MNTFLQRSRRGESCETINEESPGARGRTGMRNASHSASSQKRALYRKAVSMGDGMSADGAGGNLWQSKESLGSNESMASNASIPLPIPVRKGFIITATNFDNFYGLLSTTFVLLSSCSNVCECYIILCTFFVTSNFEFAF